MHFELPLRFKMPVQHSPLYDSKHLLQPFGSDGAIKAEEGNGDSVDKLINWYVSVGESDPGFAWAQPAPSSISTQCSHTKDCL